VWLTVTKLADDEGQVIGIASTERDITARKRAEAELGATQRRFQELFDNVIVGLLRTTSGPEGAFIDVNPAMVKMFEADSREQLMAVHPSEIYLDPSQRRIVSDAIVSQGFIKDQEVRFKTLKGRSILCRIAAVKETDANGQVYFDSTIEDITERKRAEEALRRQTGELRARNEELARFNNAAVGRELRMVELKKQVNELCRQMGKPLLYPLDFLSAESQASTAAETVKCRESKSET
jgi:PAS domain S-box-containing protein